ncbi:hypothetical protein BC827DRAFT_261802 [Russula dissimulans]|nr:hypothetical protein BC827DRAFT_261802 [Russula dissimulans]
MSLRSIIPGPVIPPLSLTPAFPAPADELPSTIKALNDGWLATYQISTVVAALFLVVEVQLLSFIKDDSNYESRDLNKSAKHALLIFTYSALFFCLSATISGLILTDEFGELPVRASRRKDPIQQGTFDSGALDLLQNYGAKRSWIWVMWHWLFSLIAAAISLISQVLLYIWLEESDSVRITLTFITLFAAMPLLHLVPRPKGGSNLKGLGISSS